MAEVVPCKTRLTCLRLLDEGRQLHLLPQHGLGASCPPRLARRVAETAATAPQVRELRLAV